MLPLYVLLAGIAVIALAFTLPTIIQDLRGRRQH